MAVAAYLKSEQLLPFGFAGQIPVNTKHLYTICAPLNQRLRRWSSIVQMLYKCFVFTGISASHHDHAHLVDKQKRVERNTDELMIKRQLTALCHVKT